MPLGCLPKDESLNKDVDDILEHLHDKYVPMTPVHGKNIPADFICLGVDQLTEERPRDIQKVRGDGCNVTERLDGVWTKNEDWHGSWL